MTWNKKHKSHRVLHKFKNGQLVVYRIHKDHMQRGNLNKTDKIMAAKLKYAARAIVTNSIGLTDDQIANMIIYNP